MSGLRIALTLTLTLTLNVERAEGRAADRSLERKAIGRHWFGLLAALLFPSLTRRADLSASSWTSRMGDSLTRTRFLAESIPPLTTTCQALVSASVESNTQARHDPQTARKDYDVNQILPRVRAFTRNSVTQHTARRMNFGCIPDQKILGSQGFFHSSCLGQKAQQRLWTKDERAHTAQHKLERNSGTTVKPCRYKAREAVAGSDANFARCRGCGLKP